MDALLNGRVFDEWRSWGIAHRLGLPRSGPFVVIAALAPSVGREALPAIGSKLRSIDVPSAWRLWPDMQIGIVHVKSDRRLDAVLALVTRLATERIGVSAQFDDLRDAPQALHFAKMMTRGPADRATSVAKFDGSILATAALSAPALMIKSVSATVECFAGIPAEEREKLFETFKVWHDNNASMNAVAAQLFCHVNTVRYRLRRIEKVTGRSLGSPRCRRASDCLPGATAADVNQIDVDLPPFGKAPAFAAHGLR
jgi:hypothetical protein